MTKDNLHERGQAMEEAFFHEVDKQLIEELRVRTEMEKSREELSRLTGIEDAQTLQDLLDQGIAPTTLASVGLIPLVAVAWADGKLESRERDAVLRAARESGLEDNPKAVDLLTSWLDNKPGPELLNAWKEYVAAMRQTLDAAALEQIHQSVVGRARKVAEAAGGFLGLINTIDPAERDVLHQLDEAFGATS